MASPQKQLLLKVSEEFLAEVDAVFPKLGFSDRSSFIRHAILRTIKEAGHVIPPEMIATPSRLGVGGSPTHKKNQGGQSAPYHLPSPSASRAAEASGPSLREEKLSKKEKDGRKKA